MQDPGLSVPVTHLVQGLQGSPSTVFKQLTRCKSPPHPGVRHVGTAPLQGLQIHPEGKHQHRFWHLPIPASSHKIKTRLRMKTKPPVTPSKAMCQDWNPKGPRVAALWEAAAGKAPLCLHFVIPLPELWR